MRVRSLLAVSAFSLSAFTFLLTGCGVGTVAPSSAAQGSAVKISGQVHGGRQPIVGARIYVLGVGTGANAGLGLAASSANQSASLLTTYTSGSFPTHLDNSGGATNGYYYVLTNSTGSFTLDGEYACTQGQQVYLYSAGGDAGAGVDNEAATLMAVLGTCPAAGTFANTVTTVSMNEISTVAAAYALAGFATDPLHISDDEAASGNTTATIAATGLTNAVANAAKLYNISDYSNLARTTTPSGNGTVNNSKVNALANSLAACVNSDSASSVACTALLGDATIDGGSGAAAADTATAAINIAHFPAHNAGGIFAPATGIATPYLPTLNAAPNDWMMGISYTTTASKLTSVAVNSAGYVVATGQSTGTAAGLLPSGKQDCLYGNTVLSAPAGVAVDTNDNFWLSDKSIQAAIRFTGGFCSSTYSRFTNSNLSSPLGIAVDASNNVFLATANAVLEFVSAGTTPYASANFWHPGGISTAWALTPTAGTAGTLWVASQQEATLLLNTGNGNAIYSSDRYTCGKNYPISAAADASGNVWTVSNQYANVYEFNSSASPVFSISGCSTGDVSNSVGYSGGGLNSAQWIAIDGNGTAWTANNGNSTISAFTNAGVAISETAGYSSTSDAGLNLPTSLAVDQSGSVWVPSSGSNVITQFIGAATPVVTPLATAAKYSKLGTRP